MRDDIALLRETIRLAEAAKAAGNHPFGALLADADGHILIEKGNAHATEGGTGHAELNVARDAAATYEPEFLETCTLYTSVEPCSMCAGGTYWAGIGRLVYGMSEERLAELTGDNPENLTMSLPCRQVLAAGQRAVEVVGPFPELEDDIVTSHKGFW
ncbi:nucleoside deaminase [Marinibacterium profundimaris]|uniref:Cytidine deaminase n=1 Tax=Marinibacterium profundimaris TaxID=1679460 RepID=A0A225NI75_9RHOB|nr:nucleoside deaminase [Marinibacterium profundimaris]OWU71039.1 cytidine deaminase [Marinibacterium profundimaris]